MTSTLLLAAFVSCAAGAAELETNEVKMSGAPKWLTAARVTRVVDKVQRFLEWDIRRISVKWHQSEATFAQAHGLPLVADGSANILAVSRRSENAIHIGPRVTSETFDGVFGHELGHIIMFQKYKDAIPRWLEEGLANYAARHGRIDYKFLAGQPAIDVRAMEHPLQKSPVHPRYHYMASTALMELLASKCRIHDLLQLSVGQKLESYLATFCRIPDLNAEFQKFLKRKAGG